MLFLMDIQDQLYLWCLPLSGIILLISQFLECAYRLSTMLLDIHRIQQTIDIDTFGYFALMHLSGKHRYVKQTNFPFFLYDVEQHQV